MGKDMKMQITIGLRNRATAGLRALRGEVQNFSSGLTSSLGASSKGLGAVAGGLDKLGGLATAVAPELGLPMLLLNTGLKTAVAGVSLVGKTVTTVFRTVGTAIATAANVGVRAFEGVYGIASRVTKVFGAVGLAAAAGFAVVAKSSLDAAMQMEGFLAKLTTATKSSAIGKQWMGWATKFAADTPFQINEVVDSATRLLLQGFNPRELLTGIGNMAGAMNKPITDAVEAYLDGLRGEWERLKEFGITGANLLKFGAIKSKNGNGVETQTAEGAAAAKKALDALMNSRFGGGMAQMMKTAAGQISNLEDGIFQLKVTVGNLLLPVLKTAVQWGQEFVAWLSALGVGEKVGAWMARAANGMFSFVTQVGAAIQMFAGGASFGDVLEKFFSKDVAETLTKPIDGLIASAKSLGAALIGSFAGIGQGFNPAEFIAGMVTRISGVMDWLTANVFAPGRLQGIWNWLAGLYVAARVFLGNVVQFVAANAPVIGAWLSYIGQYVVYLVSLAYKYLPDFLSVTVSVVAGIAKAFGFLAQAANGLKTIWDVVIGSLATVLLGAATVITYVLGAILNLVTLIIKALNALTLGGMDNWVKGLEAANKSVSDLWQNMGKATADQAIKIGVDWGKGMGNSLAIDKQVQRAGSMEATANQWVESAKSKLPQWNIAKPEMPTQQWAGFGQGAGTSTLYVPQATQAETYNNTTTVQINVPAGSNVDTRQLANQVADEVQRRQQGGYMRQHRNAALKLAAGQAG